MVEWQSIRPLPFLPSPQCSIISFFTSSPATVHLYHSALGTKFCYFFNAPRKSSALGLCLCFPFACNLITKMAEFCFFPYFNSLLKYKDFCWCFLDYLILNGNVQFLFSLSLLYFPPQHVSVLEKIIHLFIFPCFSFIFPYLRKNTPCRRKFYPQVLFFFPLKKLGIILCLIKCS